MNSLIHPALAQVIQAERIANSVGPRLVRRPRRIRGRRIRHDLRRPVPSVGTLR